MMNAALRAYIQSKDKTLEETLRKVIQKELGDKKRTAALGGRGRRRIGGGGKILVGPEDVIAVSVWKEN